MPPRLAKALVYRFWRNSHSARFVEDIHSRLYVCCVVRLIKTEKSKLYVVQLLKIKFRTVKRCADVANTTSVGHVKRSANLTSIITNDRESILVVSAEQCRAVFFYDARLFIGDLLYRIPKISRVVEGYARYDREQGSFNYICRIKPSAHTCFKYDHVTAAAAKIFKSDSGDKLKFSRFFFHRIGKRTNV